MVKLYKEYNQLNDKMSVKVQRKTNVSKKKRKESFKVDVELELGLKIG